MNIIIIQIISIILTLIFGVIICIEVKKELDETREKLKISNETSKNLEFLFYKELGKEKEDIANLL